MYYNYDRKDNRRILDGNKIQHVEVSDFFLSNCAEYVEDAHKQAVMIHSAWYSLRKAYREFQDAVSAFNKMLPSKCEQRSPYNFKDYGLV